MLPSDYIKQEHKLILRVLYCCEKIIYSYNKSKKYNQEILNIIICFFDEYIENSHHQREELFFFKAIESKELLHTQERILSELKIEHASSKTQLEKIILVNEHLRNGAKGHASELFILLQEYTINYFSHVTKEDIFFFNNTETHLNKDELENLISIFEENKNIKINYFTQLIESVETAVKPQNKVYPLIRFTKKHPYILQNIDTLLDAENNLLPVYNSVTLCRCGASKIKPYCDSSHLHIDYETEKGDYRARDKTLSYRGKEITIHDNRGVCSHDKTCIRELPSVFKEFETRWIDPDAAPKEKIIDICNRCPSGALSYSINGKKYQDLNRPPAIKIAKDGPLEIQGHIMLEDDLNAIPEIKEHYTLCRCGQTENTPFCSGVHLQIDFCDSCEEF